MPNVEPGGRGFFSDMWSKVSGHHKPVTKDYGTIKLDSPKSGNRIWFYGIKRGKSAPKTEETTKSFFHSMRWQGKPMNLEGKSAAVATKNPSEKTGIFNAIKKYLTECFNPPKAMTADYASAVEKSTETQIAALRATQIQSLKDMVKQLKQPNMPLATLGIRDFFINEINLYMVTLENPKVSMDEFATTAQRIVDVAKKSVEIQMETKQNQAELEAFKNNLDDNFLPELNTGLTQLKNLEKPQEKST